MVAKLLDNIVYISGVLTVGALTFLWDKRIKIYDPEWSGKPIYRKVLFFKYGILPQDPIYEQSYDRVNWQTVDNKEIDQLKIKPDLKFDIEQINRVNINIDINANKPDGKDRLLSSSGFWSFIR